jgi:hypothetical protein
MNGMIREWFLLFVAAAVVQSCNDLPCQGGQRWKRRRLARDMRRSAGEWCTHVDVVTTNNPQDRLARMIPYTVLHTEDDGEIYVYADNFHGGVYPVQVFDRLRATNPEAYAALVLCVASETR